MAAAAGALLAPLMIPLRPAHDLRRAISCLHTALAGVLLFALPRDATTVPLLIAAALSFGQCWRELDPPARGWCAIACDSAGRWQIVGVRGQRQAASLHGQAYVAPWIVILPLRLADGHRIRILLTARNAPPDAFRRLRVRLRHGL